jgi:hypothetical protein
VPAGTVFYFGTGGLANMVAYSPSASSYVLVHELQTTPYALPSEYTAAGMAEYGKPPRRPAVIAISQCRTRIAGIRGSKIETLVTTAEPIEQITVSDAAPLIAFVTQSGGIGIYSCHAGAMVLHPSTGGAAQ